MMRYNSAQRKAMLEPAESHLSLRQQCDLLGVARSSYYYKAAGESVLNLELMRVIDELHLLDPSFLQQIIHRLN